MLRNGTAKFTNVEGLLSWYRELSLDDAHRIKEESITAIKEALEQPYLWDSQIPGYNDIYDQFSVSGGWGGPSEDNSESAKWERQKEDRVRKVAGFISMATDFHQPVHVSYWIEGKCAFLNFGNPKHGLFVVEPEKYLEYIPEQDFSDLTPAQVRAMLQAPKTETTQQIIPQEASSLSVCAVTEMKAERESNLEKLKADIQAVQNAETEELAALQEEIRQKQEALQRKQEEMLSDLNEKKAKYEQELEQMKKQIYLLDSEIYAIRCYAGEVVKFGQIRNGKNAPDNEPIIIHQKLRYLDEDLGRLASLYEIDWDDLDLFESFLKHSPLALDTFAPNERCVVLVRLSKNALQYFRDDKRPQMNMLEAYNYYHGRTIGIIIRNGENLYLGWTEEDRVQIEDDLILKRTYTETTPGKEMTSWEEAEMEAKNKKIQEEIVRGLVSRTFVYNVLQGVVENTNMLPLPKGVSLSKESEYVRYSVADKWLTDSRFGSFTDIIERVNAKVSKGDHILMVQHLIPEPSWGYQGSYTRAWDNSRGIGERNRTHDVSASDCTIYPVNKIVPEPSVPYVSYRMLRRTRLEGEDYWISMKMKQKEFEWKLKEGNYRVVSGDYDPTAENNRDQKQDLVKDIEYFVQEYPAHVYISLEKERNWRRYEPYEVEPRANFEVYSNEYINLTYMNSVWLEWVITTKTLGGWRVGGKDVDYAYAIRYLKTALDFVRKREAKEKSCIDAVDPTICQNSDWPLWLTEWKLETGVRTINAYQAKRFAKYLSDKKKEM